MTSQLWWYVARSAGMVGWVLLAASVMAGLVVSTKTRPLGMRPNWLLDLHRFLGGMATIFTGVHITGLVADSYTHFGPSEVLIPFASSWRPDAVAWGIAGMYLLVAVELTSLARRRLPKQLWRAVHMASFPLFAFGTVHALTAGTDTSNPIFITTVWLTCAVVVALTVHRLQQFMTPVPARDPHHIDHRPGSPAGVGATMRHGALGPPMEARAPAGPPVWPPPPTPPPREHVVRGGRRPAGPGRSVTPHVSNTGTAQPRHRPP